MNTVHHSAGKVIGDQASPDFLGNERSLFRVEFGETNGILQVAKRGFDTPTAEIELFEFIKGEIIYREIGNESLIIAGREFKIIYREIGNESLIIAGREFKTNDT